MAKISGLLAISALVLILFSMSVFILPTHAAATVSLGTSGYTETTITLTWSQSGDTLFSNYKLYMSSTGTNGPYTAIWSSSTKSQTSAYVDNLTPSTNYWFYIKDTDLLGSANSNTFQISTSKTPTITSTSTTATTVSLQWDDYNYYSSLVPFTSYVIQMSANGGQLSTLTTITDASQSTYTVTGLSTGTYEFTMSDKVGTSGQYQSSSIPITVSLYQPVQVQIPIPSSTNVDSGKKVQLNADATGGTGVYNYQWYLNGNQISGATSSSYTYVAPNVSETDNIQVTAQDAQDSSLPMATSNTVTLVVPVTGNFQSTIPATPTPTPTTPEFTLPIVIVALIIVACSAISVRVIKQKSI